VEPPSEQDIWDAFGAKKNKQTFHITDLRASSLACPLARLLAGEQAVGADTELAAAGTQCPSPQMTPDPRASGR